MSWYEWLPAWLAAAGTVGALFYGFGVLRQQGEQLAILKGQNDDREVDRRSQQARLISAWITTIERSDRISREGYDSAAVGVVVSNRSDEPVYDCCVHVKSTWGPTYEREFKRIQVLPPGREPTCSIRVDLPKLLTVDPPVEVTFTDAAGRHWRRRDFGELEEWVDIERPPESQWPDY